jgi:hypothetical protein
MRGTLHARRHGRRAGPSRYSPTAGLPFDPDDLESRLVWIWGSQRTGSTWLLRQLCHPLRLSAKFRLGFTAPKAWDEPLDALPVDEFLVSRHIAPASGAPLEVDDELVPATLNNYVGEFPAYAFAGSYADVWMPELRRLVLVRLNAMIDRAEGEGMRLARAPLVVIKEVNGSHASDVVMSLFPRSRMLFLVRDGRDVVDSRVHASGEGGWLATTEGARFSGPEQRLEWVREAAREWACNMDVTRRAYGRHAPELRRTIRYEDLLRDNVGVLQETFDWLKLDRDRARVERTASATSFAAVPEERRGEREPFRAATPGLWREHFTPDEQATLEDVLGSRLRALGYEAVTETGRGP